MGRFDFAAVATYIRKPHVIDHDDDDVGSVVANGNTGTKRDNHRDQKSQESSTSVSHHAKRP